MHLAQHEGRTVVPGCNVVICQPFCSGTSLPKREPKPKCLAAVSPVAQGAPHQQLRGFTNQQHLVLKWERGGRRLCYPLWGAWRRQL